MGYSPELLQLDDNSILLRRHLAQTALFLYSATIMSSAFSPLAKRMTTRLESPQSGDLVFERTKAVHSDDLDIAARGTGLYLRAVREQLISDAEWDLEVEEYIEFDEAPPPPPLHIVHYVQYGPDNEDISRWVNSMVLVIPDGPDFFKNC